MALAATAVQIEFCKPWVNFVPRLSSGWLSFPEGLICVQPGNAYRYLNSHAGASDSEVSDFSGG
jgi:hypothetical protein